MNIPNQLTLLRIVLIPIFIVVLTAHGDWGQLTLGMTTIPMQQCYAAIIFAVASITDYFDGYLARKYQLVTAFGAFFDPMADKLLVVAAFLLLVEMQQVPAWVVIIIISRELMVTGLRVLLAQHDGKVMSAALPGKIKTFSQMFAIVLYLLNNVFFNDWHIPMASILLYTCLFFTVYSGVDYFYHARFIWKK